MRRALLLLSLCLSGCGPAPIYVQVEVWNRTLDPIYVLDQDGKRLDVPACGHAVAPIFRVNEYAVWSDAGRYFRSSVGGQGPNTAERFIVLSPRMEPSVHVAASDPLPKLPPCEGHPTLENQH